MNCPKCNITLSITDRQGVEIDFCPTCRGVWLDRGELDKIIERSSTLVEAVEANEPSRHRENRHRDFDDDDDDYYRKHGRRKKKGFFSEIFDF